MGTGTKKSRIDMALGNDDWCNVFPNAKLYHLVQAGSDHCPIMLLTELENRKLWRPFKFYIMWIKNNAFKQQLVASWNTDVSGSPANKLTGKHHVTRKRLSYWNKIEFGDIDRNINKLQDQILAVQQEQYSNSQHDKLIEINKNLEFWEDISRILVTHFSDVSCSSNVTIPDHIFNIIPTVFNENDVADSFNRIPTDEEIFQTVKSMSSWSSPGPDGFQAGFYQSNWNIVGYMPTEFNKTYLSLIPKTDTSKYVVDFRPIGLCNTVYKLISKILSNRIKPHLKHIISPCQDAFVPGRIIHDNIIIFHEMIHTMKHKEGSSGTMDLKLDLSKAFDRLEWPFLFGMLRKIGFHVKFCKLVEQCISTSKISILLNGSPTEEFYHTRGIRQGDSLSPYMFIIAMEFLSRLLTNAANNHVISGFKDARNAPGITHLLFADDILIFAKADMHNIAGILDVLEKFGMYSGQMLNFGKSSVYFSKNISLENKTFLTNALKMSEMKDSDKYLGVTLLLGRDKTKAFKPILQSFGSRYKNWKGKTMNHSARTTMVKHVLNTLPSHKMRSFRIPKTMITQLDTLQRQFWWGKEKGLFFIGWNKLMVPKALGGLGFRNLEHFNTALLAKVAWRACNDEDSLCFEILKAKYSKDGNFLQCGTKINIWLDCWIIGLDSPPVPIVGSSSYSNFTLIPSTGEDFLIWKPDRKGQFSVKSAYNTICTNDVNSIVSIDTTPKEVWSQLWHFRIPHRVQLFIWKWNNTGSPLCLTDTKYVYRLMTTMCFVSNSTNVLNIKAWVPPDKEFVKINIDGSYKSTTKKGSIGLILRDSADQQSHVHWFNSNIVEKVKSKCNSSNRLWFFKSIHRLGNNVAHSLARKARDDEQDFCFVSDFPVFISKLLEKDHYNLAV
ncbi:uncharacterized protein LOC113345732 [Papaver somniferum]|uniref:uncharacterized protein LOC113345732 n=1 Tax=Papaver somniferum TaxID=3469 RepID=UPI000E6F639D|nr:uncharacterized protein LOC113345732 [Papaver somniferum]